MIFTRKMIDLTPLQKLPKNKGDLGQLLQKALKTRPIWSPLQG